MEGVTSVIALAAAFVYFLPTTPYRHIEEIINAPAAVMR